MKIKDTKKLMNADSDQTSSKHELNNNRTQKLSTSLYSNENTGSNQQNAYSDDRNVNTHFFDRDEYKAMPDHLRQTGNAIALGQNEIRTAKQIASQLNIPVRKFYDNVERLRAKYTVTIIGSNHRPKGFYIATSVSEAEPYLRQQKAREDRGAKARHGVETGLTNGFLEDVQQWQKGAQHD
ncbi:hypothetical protein [Oenococcus sicerae]|uniref:hypothetical protein n=1 Tax=Oenococcus sicerae TaxID=2203724 RepID=UPI0039E8D703